MTEGHRPTGAPCKPYNTLTILQPLETQYEQARIILGGGTEARTPLESHPAKDEPAGEKPKSKPVKRASSRCTNRIAPTAGEKATWGDVSVGVWRETHREEHHTESGKDGKVSLVEGMRKG